MSPNPTLPTPFVAGAVTMVPRDVIRAMGPDTEAFLQGQLSQDIVALADGDSAWSLLLQPQGKVDSWLRVHRLESDSFVLDVDAGFGEATLARLGRFLLRTACDLTLSRWDCAAFRGPGSWEAARRVEATLIADAQWPGVEAVDALGDGLSSPEGHPVASEHDYATLRILCGVPSLGAELDEQTIPAEAGIVERSVSFTKGCFTGQELVARIDSRGGKVPRRLCGIVAEDVVEPGAVVLVDGVEVGRVTSASDAVALAYVHRRVDTLPAKATVGGVPGEVRKLPLL